MVLQKRLDYGFNGFQVPFTPRAARSARKRCSSKKRAKEDNHMCAFDLLASVAGKLLLEKEGSPSSSNTSHDEVHCAVVKNTEKKDIEDENRQMKVETYDRAILDNACFGFASAITSEFSEGLGDQKLATGKAKNEAETLASRVDLGPNGYNRDCKLDGETKAFIKDESPKTVWEGKPPAWVSSDSSAKVPLSGDESPHSSIPKIRDHVNVVSRDDDENSSGCTHPRAIRKSYRPTPRIGDRRIRKILASRHWKVAPKLKDESYSKNDCELRAVHHNRNNYYRSLRSERNYPIKKRRLFDYNYVPNYDRQISSENVSASLAGDINGDVSNPKIHGGTRGASSMSAPNKSFQSRDSHVKLRIKSFKVPELLIEVPENATVGSLKRRVMEAMSAVLGGGLRVGVLLQGKKVRDDSKTLLQTGIACDNELDALGFSLEPQTSQTPPPLRPLDSSFMLPRDSPQPLPRYLPAPSTSQQCTSSASLELPIPNMGSNFIESDHDSAPSPTDMPIEKSTKDSKALVPVPAMSVEALAVVPVHRKSKRSEIVQRRIRRPFSVTEVEALVQAVEKLGTGRWRDVKLRAFDNAKHRTYVDLKDKWKTLVHTAKISPQQRRGEPVPQELLDRVLTAHAYWSQQQAKQQKLQQQPETYRLL